jgi:hypothetical protein
VAILVDLVEVEHTIIVVELQEDLGLPDKVMLEQLDYLDHYIPLVVVVVLAEQHLPEEDPIHLQEVLVLNFPQHLEIQYQR